MSSSTSVITSKIIQAGAGAGKTTNLIQTFVDFVGQFKKKHQRYPRIVVTTFTKKATQELKERLLAKAYQLDDLDLAQYLGSSSQVHISTIHGILVPFLSKYGNKSGLNPEVRIMSQLEQQKSYRKLLKKIFLSHPESLELLEYLSWDELIQGLHFYFQKRIELGTFNFDHSGLLKKWSEEEFLSWNQQRANLQLKLNSEKLNESWKNYTENFFRHLTNWEEAKVWMDSLGRKPPFKDDKPVFSVHLHDDLKKIKKFAEDILDKPLLFSKHWFEFDLVQKRFCLVAELFYAEALKTKLQTGLLSLSDLESMSLQVIQSDPSLVQNFSEDWDFWMIDEYQDTSPIQVQLLGAFIQKSPHFVVGDPQQSIYLFRGARKEVFQDKIQFMQKNNFAFEKLNHNYRSSFALVHFFNQLFSKLSPDFMQMVPHQKADENSKKPVTVTIVPESDETLNTEDSEVLTVLAQIQNLIQSGVQPQQIAILTRTNSKVVMTMKLAQKYGLALESPSLSDYWKRREVQDLILLTQFLLNPHNNINLVGLFRSPWFYIEDSQILLLRRSNSFWKMAQTQKSPDWSKAIQSLQSLIEVSQSMGVSTAIFHFLQNSDFLWSSRLVDSSGRREANIWKFLTELRQKEKQPGLNLLEFMDEILVAENNSVDLSTQEAAPLLQPNRVTLMTIHASKGLEFDHVFLLGMGQDSTLSNNQIFSLDPKKLLLSVALRDDDGKWMYSPASENVRNQMRIQESEESLRVLYVAMTRAKKSLNLSLKKKFKKNSWWGLWPLPQEAGLHQFDHFELLVQEQLLQPQAIQKVSPTHQDIIQPVQLKLPEVLARKSVTAVLDSQKSEQTGPRKKVSSHQIEALKKAQLGTFLHRLFESLAHEINLDQIDPQWKSSLDFLIHLQDPPMKQILKIGHPEWGFAVQMDDYVLQGAIDLWAELPDAVYILDYKTGSTEYVDSAMEQMKIYSSALKKMRAVSPHKVHKLVALYPLEQRVMILEQV